MKRVISLLLSLLIVCGVSVFPIMGVYAAELTAQDKMALEMANQYKDSFRDDAKSYADTARFNEEVAKEIVIKENIMKFCGSNVIDVIFGLADLTKYFDIIKDAGSKCMYGAVSFAVINEGVSYMEQGEQYFAQMNAILDKYGDGEITDPDDARKILKARYYGAEYCLYGAKMCMPFIEKYANGKTLMDVFSESFLDSVSSDLGSNILGEIFEFKNFQKVWDMIDKAGSDVEKGQKIIEFLRENMKMKLDLSQVDSILAKMENTSGDKTDEEQEDIKLSVSDEIENTKNYTSITIKEDTILHSNVSYGNLTIKADFDLNGHYVYANSITIDDYVDINGGTLNITGSVRHLGGDLKVNNGTLNIGGSYNCLKETVNNIGQIERSKSHGSLIMTHKNDKVNVSENFVTDTYGSSYTGQALSAGILTVTGEIYDYDGDITADGTHKTVLNGTGKQIVELSNGSCFNQLEITSSTNKSVDWSGRININKFIGEAVINSNNAYIDKLILGSADTDLTIKDDVEIKGDVDINAGVLSVNGNVLHSSGRLYIHNGILNIAKDYRQQSKTVDNIGNITYSSSSGYLSMLYANDQVNIRGNMYLHGSSSTLSAGNLYLAGDFTAYNSNANFSNSHVTSLTGTGKQSVTFYSKNDKFNTLLLTKNLSNYEFYPEKCWVTLVETPCEHSYSTEIIKESTCYDTGIKKSICTICGLQTEEVIPVIAHTYNSVTKKPTCIKTGYTTYTCIHCGYAYRGSFTTFTDHKYSQENIDATPNLRGYTKYTCDICGDSYIDNITDYASDNNAFVAALDKTNDFEEADYSTESYNDMWLVCAEYSNLVNKSVSQIELDKATADILEAIYDLEPYLNFTVSAENGSYEVSYDEITSSESKYSLLFGTEITLSATANEGYEFVGWYDTINNLYFSKESTYTFKLTENTNLKAMFVKERSATLTFTTYSNWVQSAVTKTIDEWNNVISIEDLLPQVPYRYGYSNGRWVYDNADVLSKLQTGESVFLIPEYDEDDTSLPTPRESVDGVPALDLYYKLDADANVGSFVMAAGIPDDYQIESVGVAFYYKKANDFDPTKFELLNNNKMLVSRFNTDEIEDIYIVNMNKFTPTYNWAVRGYVTYYDADGNLKTAYSNQINIVNREQV